ncbi:SpoIIE family protein phosphatase [Actinomycetospora termitidis]|uniref:histidine kinase n=1 Tax=Actinomycetospora termitidis TaxID=3053470 RepID=A0ABT7MD95_9PSEU|nr:SpoIIE family protein phosphatase [Actinomycetospora sp. Odt1-22]MDL5158646.1 SpoIIE family protein phosphatase [Actinomycetospora sp. Odt1-22]
MDRTDGAVDPLFAGRAGVAEAMAAVDWAATPLGPSQDWPTSLRSVVRVLLTSRFSMWMAWGPELTFFYNDSYQRDTLRGKHPWAVGRPFREVWSEVYDAVSPQVRAVIDHGESTWDEDLLLHLERHGWPEETYHTFSYSPLADEDGRVHGLFCAVVETTPRVLSERRMAFLRDLASAMTSARTTGEVARAAQEVLGDDHRDVPFGLVYLRPDGAASDVLELAAAMGISRGGAAAPPTADLGRTDAAAGSPWPLARAREGTAVVDLPSSVRADVPDTCDRAALVPLRAPGAASEELLGVLVVGLSRFLAFDDPYRDFVELVAGQVTSGVLDARAAESERRRAEALAELDEARRRFFADASHELRTPLTLIAGPVDGLLADPDLAPGRARADLEVVARNARRLTRLVGDLLEVARLQAGSASSPPLPLDLGRATVDVAGMVASAMQRAGLEYVVDAPSWPVPVAVARDGWERIVLNLVANALKYTRTGRVEVRLRREDGHAVLTVTDTGIGIPADEVPRLFDRFHRVEGTWARSAEGSGIGLALVRELVEFDGGSVDVRSEVGVGSTFTVTLPVREVPAPGPTDDDATGPTERARALVDEAELWVPTGSDASGSDAAGSAVIGRVLVADDNADMRAYITRLLAPRCTVTTATDGEEALRLALADPPDMIVSDVMMPGRDGLALLTALRSDPRTARVPVLLLSARAGEEAAVEGLAAQADDYLVKPFSPGELQARVQAHLQLGRSRREAEARFTAVADLAPAMIWVSDARGRRVFLNAGWSRFTGRDQADELGEGWVEGVHPDDRAGYDELVARGRELGRAWETDFRLRHADGTYHRLVEQATPVPGPDGRATGWVGSAVDVETRLQEADRARLLAEVGAAMESTDTVAGRLRELSRVLHDAHLADRVTVLDDEPEPDPRTLQRVLRVRDRTLGVLVLARDGRSAPWTDADRALVDEVVARTLPGLDNALLYADERSAAHRLAIVHHATAAFSAAATPAEVARAATDHVVELLGQDIEVAVFEYDAAQRQLRMVTRRPVVAPARSHGDVVPLEADTLLTRAVVTERSLWVHEPEPGEPEDAQDPELVALMRDRGLQKVVTIPLIAAGSVVGALAVGRDTRGRLDAGERLTLQSLAEPCAVALDRARLYRAEHEIAQTLQRSLLPQALPEVARLPIAVRYLPGAVGTSAGGDWYDVVEVGPHHVAVVVGDVVGQGTAAAAVMGQLRTALSGYLLAGHGPGPALDLLDGLVARVPGARASTAICLVVDTDSGEVHWARAGHLPALLVDADGPRLLTDPAGHGPLLGLAHDRRRARTEGVTRIVPGDDIVLYTDGLVERRGESLDDGLDRLLAVAASCTDVAPEPVASVLLDALAPAEAIDDVAVVVVRLAPAPLDSTFRADPAELAVLRRAVRAWAVPAGLRDEVVEDLQLALGEAATNAVEHAYGTVPPSSSEVTVHVAARPDGGVAVRVTDRGAWRDIPRDPGHRGRGLSMIRALASDVVVDGGPGGTTVSFTVPPGRRAVDRGRIRPPQVVPADEAVSVDVTGSTVEVTGDLDLVGADVLGRILAHPPGPEWSLDVTGVGHLASAGVGVLLAAADQGARLVLPRTGPAARVLALNGLTSPTEPVGRP